MKPRAFASLCLNNSDAWKADWDVYINPETLKTLSYKCMVDEALIKRSSFYYNCDYFYNQTGKTPQVKWVMPIGVRAKGQKFGIQFCPCCLAEDGDKPYFRRHWRLAFFTACPYHSVQLHDRCSQCGSPVDIKRPQKEDSKRIFSSEDIVYCPKCRFDYRKAEICITPQEELEFNIKNMNLYKLGYGSVGNQTFNYSNLYFEGLRRILSFLICSPKGVKLLEEIRPDQNIPVQRQAQLEPELMPIGDRRLGQIACYAVLQDWPGCFISASKKSNTSTQHIYSPYFDYPYWLFRVIQTSLKIAWR